MKLMTKLHCTIFAYSLATLPLFAATPATDTVKIGKETKKTVGTLTKAVNGDVACYLTLKDDRGVVFDEMADFSICEKPKLIGKRLLLKYSLENVMADECQGNPDCTKSKKVALVTSVQVLGNAASKPAAPKPPSKPPAAHR
ncbi:MAG: hypothetical protein QOK37_396 [Thermoanaerobaculia bacterium]|jgi:hypothetical protein|nr:hypothetical protein [Thermoanaerobaculia bacterium]